MPGSRGSRCIPSIIYHYRSLGFWRPCVERTKERLFPRMMENNVPVLVGQNNLLAGASSFSSLPP